MTEEKTSEFLEEDNDITKSPIATLPDDGPQTYTPSVEDFLKSLKADLHPSSHNFPSPTPTETRQRLMEKYADEFSKRGPLQTNQFIVLKGWQDKDKATQSEKNNFQYTLKRFLLPKDWQKTCGGFFLRYQNRGFVINPGPSFVENFHAQGFFVQDIDYVIMTSETEESYWDLAALYELNYEQNKLTKELHVINYYIPQVAFQSVASIIKPHFKQERQTIHPMEFYLDSFESESINLEDSVHLAYFPEKENSELGIRLEFSDHLSIGWCSHFSGSLHPMHENCQLIIANVDKESLNKAYENKSSSTASGILVVSENTDREEEKLFEIAKEVKQLQTCSSHSAVFPAEMGLCLNLPDLSVRCSTCGQLALAQQVSVIKSSTPRLQFICNHCRF